MNMNKSLKWWTRRLLFSILLISTSFYTISLLTQWQVIQQQQIRNNIKKPASLSETYNSHEIIPQQQQQQQPVYEQQQQPWQQLNQFNIKIPYKLVHIDLKGAPPKLSYLTGLLKDIKNAGGNGILLEYEDMFPYRNELINITNKKCFSEKELKKFLQTAVELDLEIIPLIQTFGHLEYLLKYEDFKELREIPAFPQEICPSFPKGLSVVEEMVKQVISFHASVLKSRLKYIHIGCDEVFHLAECSRCRGKDAKELFVSHVIRIAKHIKNNYGLSSIIWDDMMRKFYTEELTKSDIGKWVELMVWDYTEDVDHLVSPYLWPMYTDTFPNIWVASAFKGAFGESLYQVMLQRHALNHISWLKVLSREQPRIRNFRGIALTGWSRYDHFSVLCELLPVSYPSLILSLEILKHQDLKIALKSLSKDLKCAALEMTELSLVNLGDCKWNGYDLYEKMSELKFHEDSILELCRNWDDSHKGWLTKYNIKYNESSSWRLEEVRNNARQFLESLLNFEKDLKIVMETYFDENVIKEYSIQRVGWLKGKLEGLLKDVHGLMQVRVWKRRPFL